MESKAAFSTTAIIVGAGPAGLSAAACLTSRHIPVIILERDDTIASLWRRRTYDRLHLHLPKHLCELPLRPYPPSTPTFLPRADFLRYLDDYAEAFGLEKLLRLRRRVVSAEFDAAAARWRVTASNLESGTEEEYEARFMVVASGENDEPVLPEDADGLDRFSGEAIHSSQFRAGKAYKGLDVLVVGSGNSGMEIACDLAESGAHASIVVRSRVHLLTKEIFSFAFTLKRFLPVNWVDSIVLFLCYLRFGNTSKYGIQRPSKGPIYLKFNTPLYPVVDVGTFAKIKSGEIEVLTKISTIEGKNVTFENGKQRSFDVIILATGYRSTVKKWLKGDTYLIGEDGMGKQELSEHWKGMNGLYCAGFLRKGIYGAGEDAINIANDINNVLMSEVKQKMA